MAVTAGFVVLLLVLAVVGSLWRRSVLETRRAEAETKRAEAQKLLALGEIQLEANPTEALAWARASLDVSDTREGRLLAVRALSKGPIARAIKMSNELGVVFDNVFSPDGEWIALRGNGKLKAYRRPGGGPAFVDAFPTIHGGSIWPFFDPSSRNLGARKSAEIRTYSVPDFAEKARHQVTPPPRSPLYPFQTDRGVFFVSNTGNEGRIELWRPGSPLELVTTTPPLRRRFRQIARIGAAGEWAAYVPREENDHVYLKSLTDPTLRPHLVHVHDTPISDILLDSKNGWIAVRGKDSPAITMWSIDNQPKTPLRTFSGGGLLWMSHDETHIIENGIVDGDPIALVWDLEVPAGAKPHVLRWRRSSESIDGVAIDPTGRWATAGAMDKVLFWPLPVNPPVALGGYEGTIYDLKFTTDGNALVIPVISPTGAAAGVHLQPIVEGGSARLLLGGGVRVAVDPGGRFAVISGPGAVICPFDGSAPKQLEGLSGTGHTMGVAYDPDRELIAAGVFGGKAEDKVIGVWNLKAGTMQKLGPADDAGASFTGGYVRLAFLRDGSLLSVTREGVIRRWHLEDGSSELLFAENCVLAGVKPDGETAVVGCIGSDGSGELSTFHLATKEIRPLGTIQQQGRGRSGVALSHQGDVIAVGHEDGTVEIRRLIAEASFSLFGHESPVYALAFSPDGTLLASAGQDGTVRVWPVPDLSEPPLQALPHDELLAKLDTFTNLRVVRDEASPTGWKVELGPFPGWETVPEW